LLEQAAGHPVSGVILISDGGQNAGLGPEAALQVARDRQIPIFTIGIGSDRLPPSVRVSAFDPPPRAFPGDPYTVTGVIQAWRMAGQVVAVRLLARDAEANTPADRWARTGKKCRCALKSRPTSSAGKPCACASKPRKATAAGTTTSWKPTSKSWIARRACCCWPAVRHANTSSCATCFIATVRSPWTCCSRPPARDV